MMGEKNEMRVYNKTHYVNKQRLCINEIISENNITNKIDINVLLNIIQVQYTSIHKFTY